MISRIYRFFVQSIRNQLLLAMIAVSLPALLGGITYSVYVTRNLALSSTERSQQNRVTALALRTGEFLSGVRGDVLFLSRLDTLYQMLELQLIGDAATYEAAREAAEQEFLDFSQVKGSYYQVRFMNAQGREVVRVDSDGAQSWVVSRDQLQNQAAWIYFDEAIRAAEGEVLVSPLVLSVARGEVERPLKPVIHYATPVWFKGYVFGVVMVSVSADHFLTMLGAQAEAGEVIVLTDEAGYYLYHSADAAKCWGRDLRTDLTFLQDYPATTGTIFNATNPAQSGILRVGTDFLAFQRFSPAGTTAYQWILFSIRPYRAAMAPLLRFAWVMLWWLLLGIVGVLGIGHWSGIRLVQPIRTLSAQVAALENCEFDKPIVVGKEIQPYPDEMGGLVQTVERTRIALGRARADWEGQIQRLEARVAQLQTAANISHTLMTTLDPQKLLSDGVNVISARLGFYHVGIFLLDEMEGWLILRAASSQGGQRLLNHGYRVRVGQAGVVGLAASTGEPHVATVGAEETWLPTRADLPDTHAEMALPLKLQERVLGVLDVHSVLAGVFTADDVAVLQLLANQLTLLWHNNQRYKEAQDRYEAILRAQGEQSRQAWAELSRALAGGGYRYYRQTLSQAGDFWQPEMTAALQRGEMALADAAPEAVALPLRVRDQIIGVVDARKPDGTLWSAEELALLETVRGRLEVALESARFYRDSQRSAAREQLLREITERIRSAVDVESVMRTAVLEIGRTLGREVFVYLADQPGQAAPTAFGAIESGDEG